MRDPCKKLLFRSQGYCAGLVHWLFSAKLPSILVLEIKFPILRTFSFTHGVGMLLKFA
uniref:Uncharacterized protein n=1 Tax=Ornithodoros brasiliensis TaxID=888526 RepID=A0A1D2AIZ5_ORNBR